MSLWAQLAYQPPRQSGNPLRNILLTGTVYTRVNSAENTSFYAAKRRQKALTDSKTLQVFSFTVIKAELHYSLEETAQNYTNAKPQICWNTQAEEKIPVKVTHRAALCFTGCCAPESPASRMDAPLERWIFQEKRLQWNRIAHASEGGGAGVWSTIYYLSNSAHLWTTTNKTQQPCRRGSRPKLKQETLLLSCRLRLNCADQQPTSCFYAKQMIWGDQKMMQAKRKAQRCVFKTISYALTFNLTASLCLQVCVTTN